MSVLSLLCWLSLVLRVDFSVCVRKLKKKSHQFISIIYICKDWKKETNHWQLIFFLLVAKSFFFVCCCQWRGLLEIHLVALPCYVSNTVYFIIFKLRLSPLKPVRRFLITVLQCCNCCLSWIAIFCQYIRVYLFRVSFLIGSKKTAWIDIISGLVTNAGTVVYS